MANMDESISAGGGWQAEGCIVSRYRRATEHASRSDRRWFARHPFQHLRLRDSIAFEHPDWDAEGHVRNPFVLVSNDPDAGTITCHPFYAHQRPKDDTATLLALLEVIEVVQARHANGGSGTITQAENDAVAFPRPQLAEVGDKLDAAISRFNRKRRRAIIVQEATL